MSSPRQYRAGQTVEDHCRSCHEDRIHTVIVVDAHAQPLRVACDFCRSEHNYRGGPRSGLDEPARRPASTAPAARPAATPLPIVSDRESVFARAAATPQASPMSHPTDTADLELLIRRIIREETGLTPVAPAEKWRGGELVLRPGRPGVQEKSWSIESFFHKIVMLRNRLRTLEQQLNASDLPDDQKLKIQSYITGCYGSLTSFNVLFAEEADRFVGASSD
ncbi:MAG: hypothetical protein ABI039_13385 [Vicinamibacterales bacterium]